MNGGENKIVTHSATQLPNGGKQPVSNKLVIAVVSLAILTFLGILSETAGRARGQLPDAARRPTGHVARRRHLLVAHHQHHSGKAPLEQRGSMLGIVSLVTCAAPAIGPVFGGVLKSHFPPKFIIIGFAGTVIMDAVFVTLSGNVWVVAIAANDGADAAGSYMIAFPRSMMVFAGMAVLGVILASLMFRFSTRRPPEMREVK